jgi:dipeptidyl aminopeptidase/acylaminoacyl peptidase
VLLNQYIAANHAIAIELNLTTGETKTIQVNDEQAYNAAAAYLPGETAIAFISDVDNGIRQCYTFDLATGATKKPLPGDINKWEVESGEINQDRSLAALVFNENGYGSVRVFRLPGFDEIKLTLGEQGLYGDIDLRGNQLSYTINNARTPGLAFTKGVFTREMPRQLTAADTQGIDLAAFTLPQLVEYKSFDGVMIPAFMYLPPGYTKGQSIPFIANYHGGPEGQSRPRFDPLTQYWLACGYGVIQPNVRGSSGYGRAFLDMDNYKLRWDSVRDGVEAVRWLISEGYSSAGRVAAYGGSYGGFMAVATIIEGGTIYGASIDVVGIVNFQTFLEQTKDYRRKLREVEYGPLTDPDFLKSISPIHRIDEIQVPMMIAHGLNDPRVPVGEAMQLAVGLQKRGYDPELLFFPDEGHGFAKLENRLLFADRADRFLRRHLGEP